MNECSSELLLLVVGVVVVAGGREQVHAAWLLKIGGSSVCFHVMGPEI